MNKLFWLKVIIPFVLITGCENYKYHIEMNPEGEEIGRKIVWPKGLNGQEHLVGLYKNRTKARTFYGKFKGELPKDIGGGSFYACSLTSMGRASFYSERFRGEDNLNAKIDEMRGKVDNAIDVLIGWLEYELGKDANFENLRKFCDNELREDCKNIIYYVWLDGELSKNENLEQKDMEMRYMHYLIERGYFNGKDILHFEDLGDVSEDVLFERIRRLVAEKMGYSDSTAANQRLYFLTSEERVEESFERYIPSTDLYKELWEKEKRDANDPDTCPPEVDISDVVEAMGFDFDLFSPTHEVEVVLACESEPFYSNGDWNEETKKVVWSSTIAGNFGLPTLLYNMWAVADKEFQAEHFGCVILSGKDLAKYCVWRKSLDEEKAKEWEAFLSSLRPGKELKKKVFGFRFSDYRKKNTRTDAQAKDLAKMPRELIFRGLKAKRPEQKPGTSDKSEAD